MILTEAQRARLDLVIECHRVMSKAPGGTEWTEVLEVAEFVYNEDADMPTERYESDMINADDNM